MKNLRNKEHGTAIISALFLMGVVAMLAVTMLTRQTIEIRRTELIFQEERLLAQVAWVELWGINTLNSVFEELTTEQDFITLEQSWAEPLPEFQQEGILLSGEIIDLQGQFNINNLLAVLEQSESAEEVAEAKNETGTEKTEEEIAEETAEATPIAEQEAKAEEEAKKDPFDKDTPFTTPWMFARLINNLTTLNISDAQATTENILHWMKPEITEWDNDYENISPPYRPAHQLLQSISELRLILNVEREVVNALQPYLSAYLATNVKQAIMESASPSREAFEQRRTRLAAGYISPENYELFPINVNTTTAPVLASVLDIEIPQASNVISARPFYNQEELQAELSVLNLVNDAGPALGMLTVTSHYFLIKAIARDDRRAIVQYTLVKRDEEGKLMVIRRALGEL